MIKFEFALEDVDAENLFGCIQSRINQNSVCIMDALFDGNGELIKSYQEDSKYYEQLKLKLTNHRIK